MTLNAGRWASAAKDNVVKISSTAAAQATELTGKVKEGSLFNSFSNVGTKAWTNVSTYLSSEQLSSLSNSASTLFRTGYNSVPGENGNSPNTSNNLFSDDSNEASNQRSFTQSPQKQESKPKQDDDWNWDSNWETSKSKTQSINKTKAKDLMNFEDDNWETIEPSKSK